MVTILSLLVILFFIGLINPKVLAPYLKSYATRKWTSIFFGATAIVLLLMTGSVEQKNKDVEYSQKVSEIRKKNALKAEQVVETSASVPVEETTVKEFFEVVSVTDGDTLKVNINGTTETLRLIGIDTPETVDPRKPVQCFGEEASKKAKETLTGKKVSLEADPTQGERDKYQRLLRYVYLEDGTFFNKWMIQEGYAHEYTYQSNPYKYQTEFKDAERSARDNKKGLWGNMCNGDTTQSASTPPLSTTTTPVIIPVPVASKSTGDSYSCNCSKTCAQMSCSEAQYQLNTCGCSRRDGDGDGLACDSQCQ